MRETSSAERSPEGEARTARKRARAEIPMTENLTNRYEDPEKDIREVPEEANERVNDHPMDGEEERGWTRVLTRGKKAEIRAVKKA